MLRPNAPGTPAILVTAFALTSWLLLMFVFPSDLAATVGADGAAETWYLNCNNSRLTLTISGPAAGPFTATLDQNGNIQPVDNITWDRASARLEFRSKGAAGWQWYRGAIVEGILTGRFSGGAESPDKPPLASYRYHITGWNATYLDQQLTPRVYDILISNTQSGILRIDTSPDTPSGYAGRLKIYSTVSTGAVGEESESDLEVTHWDGTHLTFIRHDQNPPQTYTGTASGRSIAGAFNKTGVQGSSEWSGVRSQVLSYGFGMPRDPVDRSRWQDRTRRQLCHLMMADDPVPLSHKTTVLGSGLMPISPMPYPTERDDNPADWPQNYRLTELRFDYSLPSPDGREPLSRSSHAYLAVPTGPPPAGGKFPAVLAVNGHGGSAWKMMNGTDHYYWYGDAFARRGFVVLALDISHRPLADRAAPYMTAPLYSNELNGDDPAHGNGLHPSIRAAGSDSDWEEDGERVWDAMRALDYLLARPDVDPGRVLVTGLSMGGEISTITSALDDRLAMSIPAAFSPDLGVVLYHGNHPCWRWMHADIREYVDTSDLFALVAPRPLIVETGQVDTTYSRFSAPFASDKQVIRRARIAYGGETGNLVHYLHYDQHNFHAGDVNPTHASEPHMRIPQVIQPTAAWSSAWQTDARTYPLRGTLFDLVSFFLQLK